MTQIKKIYMSQGVSQILARTVALWDLELYSPLEDKDEPVFFVGFYNELDRQVMLEHRGPMRFMFCGGDCRNTALPEDVREKLAGAKTVGAPSLVEDCKANNLRLDLVHAVPLTGPQLFPRRSGGKDVYVYLPHYRKEEYGSEMAAKLMRKFPERQFIVGRWAQGKPLLAPNMVPLPPWVDVAQLSYVYENCAAYVRPILRDGCSATVMEMGFMGKPSAVGAPYGDDQAVWKCKTFEDYCEFLEQAFAGEIGGDEVANYWRAQLEDRRFLEI